MTTYNGTPGSRYFESNPLKTRLQVFAPEKYSELLNLPDGTEMGLFTVVNMPGGQAIAGTMIVVGESFREQTRRYMEEGDEMSVDFAVYLLPDDVVPDEAPDNETGD